MKEPLIIPTADGSNTVKHAVTGELYHSDRGARGESLHVFIEAGLEYSAALNPGKQIKIFEIGFGTGLNAWLTLERAAQSGINIDYRTIELYPVSAETAAGLGYTDNSAFLELHAAEWEKPGQVTEHFLLTKYNSPLESFDFTGFSSTFDLIYFDAFAPDVQPELWTPQVMSRMYGILAPGGILVTYSAKGSVKQALREAGFSIERLPGALGKRHMIRATKE